jgi:hypothetical protein|tara:strand:- start:486 stop:1181 length:696 start_codon:yes stop_codon:yes gene_type:complete
MKKTIFIMALLLNGSTCFSIATDEMKGSIAILSTGVGEMEVSMLKNEDGNWVLKSVLDGGSIVQREENEIFSFDENGIKPLSYSFKQRIIFKKTSAEAKFDWSTNTVTYKKNKKAGSADLIKGTLGPSTSQLQLRYDFRELNMNSLPKELTYTVYWRGDVKERTYKIMGEEDIETPLGNFSTYKVSRNFPQGDERSQTFWLAPELDFAIIRILNIDGRETDIKIKSFEIID